MTIKSRNYLDVLSWHKSPETEPYAQFFVSPRFYVNVYKICVNNIFIPHMARAPIQWKPVEIESNVKIISRRYVR